MTLTETRTGYIAANDTMAQWKNASDIEFVYTGGNAIWSEPSVGLGRVDRTTVSGHAMWAGTTITMAQPCWDNSTKRVMMPKEPHREPGRPHQRRQRARIRGERL